MFCINCGSQNVDTTTQKNESANIQRGEQDSNGKYAEEFYTVILECDDCGEEMCKV